jgi:excisionase family DNA binding protein
VADETYTVAEVAARLKVSADTVRRWITSRALNAIEVSAKKGSRRPRYAIPADSLAAFVLRRAVGAPLPPAPRRHKAPAGVVEIW